MCSRLSTRRPPHCAYGRLEAQSVCRHTTRFVIAYVAFMPLGLWRHCGYWTLAIAPLITFMLAGIENIGVQVRISVQNSTAAPRGRLLQAAVSIARACLHTVVLAQDRSC